jgi:hypothetical protein
MGLHGDNAEILIWQDGAPLVTSVAEQAKKAVSSLQN